MKKKINITLDKNIIEKADKLANEYCISRSGLISYLICSQYDCYYMATNIEAAILKVKDSVKQKALVNGGCYD